MVLKLTKIIGHVKKQDYMTHNQFVKYYGVNRQEL